MAVAEHRSQRRAALLGVVLAAACATLPPRPKAEPSAPGRARESSARTDPKTLSERHRDYARHNGTECQVRLSPRDVEALYAYGARRLAEAKDGEHYLVDPYTDALRALRIAAEAGDLRAQTLYGTREFGDRFTNDAPEASEQAPYTFAIKYLTIAMRRGDEHAKTYFGDASGALLGDTLPESLETPLGDVPRSWVENALVAARHWLECAAAVAPIVGAGRSSP